MAIFHRHAPVRVPRRNTAIRFGTVKLEWRGYPTVKKFENMFTISTEHTNVTDGQTPHDSIGRAYA